MQIDPQLPVSSDPLPPAARKARAERRLTELWEGRKLPQPGDPIYREIERELGLSEERIRGLFAEARKVTKGRSGLYICTPTGSGCDR